MFEADPDALASILNNNGVTREQLVKSQAAEAAKKVPSPFNDLVDIGNYCRRGILIPNKNFIMLWRW